MGRVVIVPQADGGQYHATHSLELNLVYGVFQAAAVGKTVHVGNILDPGVIPITIVSQAKCSGSQQTLVAKLRVGHAIGAGTRGGGYGHVQAQHVATGVGAAIGREGQEVIDERLTSRQWVTVFGGGGQLVGPQIGHAGVENGLDVHRARAVGHKQVLAEDGVIQGRASHVCAALQRKQARLGVTEIEAVSWQAGEARQ